MSDKKNPVSTQANLSIKEKLLKNVFIAGLNSDNQPVAEKYGEDLPLEKMAQLNIFDLPELLEQILYFLEVDRSLYPALFVNHLWYHCSAPILWRRVEFFTENDYQRGWHELWILKPSIYSVSCSRPFSDRITLTTTHSIFGHGYTGPG
ncbi:hypothetical protein Glove_73g17 [Diversispora epigaea]|uniref:F-box domain-containing protein n=1 Tax=Diversispora epigaea TaxID=1348612 RepID=A0A397JE00_9GLOM|nr:hypothetical protein Glove_73g17 [Diversispora epigaea]